MTTRNAMPALMIYLETDPDAPLGGGPVSTDNRDAVRWELTRNQRNWPAGQDAPLLWLTFLAWAAAKRTGLTDLDFDTFQASAVQVATDTAAEAEPDPTQ